MKMNPYLNFDGSCVQALRFYQQVFGGELEVMTYGGSPMAADMPAEMHDRAMHACLMTGDFVLMASDAPPEHYKPPAGIEVSLHFADAGEGERIFHALADGGNVTMPFEQTFWAERFGMVTDRFGTPWIVNCDPSVA